MTRSGSCAARLVHTVAVGLLGAGLLGAGLLVAGVLGPAVQSALAAEPVIQPPTQPATQPAAGGSGAGTGTTVTGPSVISGPKVAPGIQAGSNQLRLLGQSTDVTAGGSWQVHLAIRSSAPTAEQLRLDIYPRLTTRTGFRQSLDGKVFGEPWRSAPMALDTLPVDSGGGVTLAVPVNANSVNPDIPDFEVDPSQSGLYPVQVRLLDGGKPVRTLTTYLLFSAGRPSQTDFPQLDVSLSLELGAAPPIPSSAPLTATATAASLQADAGQLSPETVSSLAAEVAALRRHPNVPLSLDVTPQTADALAALAHSSTAPPPGSEAALAASTLSGLTRLVGGDDELLPATWVKTSLSELSAAGLTNEIDQQFTAGAASLEADLHRVPASNTWVVDGPLDATTLGILQARGAERIIVPASDLRALPGPQTFTVAAPGELPGVGGDLTVEAADQELDTHFTNSPDQVLAANQLLAELAMIQLETPSRVRGVAILPPRGWTPSPAFLDTLLAGLQNNPLLKAVTAEQLLTAVPAHTAARSLAPSAPPTPLSDATTIRLARAVVQGFGSVLPRATLTTQEMTRRILLSEASQLTTAQRSDVLGPVVAAATPLDKGISLPGATSITLTARKGSLPLTILTNPSSLHPHVQLRLSSDKLTFEPFSPSAGHCTRATASAEICQLALTAPVTTIKVPVEARTSGVFTLNVSLYSPDGSLVFAANRDTVRSTAVSGVGVILIILALLGLGYWWFRDLRHGRRARRLVDVNSEGDRDDKIEEDLGKGVSAQGAAAVPQPEDTLAEFFSRPPPVYPTRPSVTVPDAEARGTGPPVSPSRSGEGPT